MTITLKDNIIMKKARRNCFVTNLSRSETNNLEKECLQLLNKNFECICKKKKFNHFPTFLKIDDEDKIHMTYCGINIKTLSRENWGIYDIQKLKDNKEIIINDAEDQINCILHNLKKNKIMNLDNHLHGNNLCILNNTIYMIDFGNAITPNNKRCEFIFKRNWKRDDIYYKYAEIDLKYILKSHEIPGNYRTNITNFDKQYDYTPFNYKTFINKRNKNIHNENN